MEIDIGKMINSVSKVTLKGGIFAKTCTVLIIVSLSFFGISYFAKNIWISAAAIGLIFILTFIILMRLINFANKNPQAAILEGAEFLVHEHIQLAAKGIPNLPDSLSLLTHDRPSQIGNLSQNEINKPDENEKTKNGEDK
jgi:hypothetical protein